MNKETSIFNFLVIFQTELKGHGMKKDVRICLLDKNLNITKQ